MTNSSRSGTVSDPTNRAPNTLRSSSPLSASVVEFSPSSRNPNSNRLLQPPRTVLHPPVPVPVVTFSILDINGVGVRFDGGGGINFDAYEDIPIEMSGSDVPPLAGTFAEIDLGGGVVPKRGPVRLCEAYVGPEAPISLAGRDLMACTQTGSGRLLLPQSSAAFSGIGCHLRSTGHTATPARSCSLCCRRGSWLARFMWRRRSLLFQRGVKVVVAYGGASMYYQRQRYGNRSKLRAMGTD